MLLMLLLRVRLRGTNVRKPFTSVRSDDVLQRLYQLQSCHFREAEMKLQRRHRLQASSHRRCNRCIDPDAFIPGNEPLMPTSQSPGPVVTPQ